MAADLEVECESNVRIGLRDAAVLVLVPLRRAEQDFPLLVLGVEVQWLGLVTNDYIQNRTLLVRRYLFHFVE